MSDSKNVTEKYSLLPYSPIVSPLVLSIANALEVDTFKFLQ